MTNVDIKISVRKLTDYSENLISTVDKKTLLLMIESFSHYVLRLYVSLIEDAINSRRYKGKWEPIDEEGYIEYLGVTPEVSILSLIEAALEVRRIGYNYIIQIDPHYRYPGTRLPLARVVRAIDSGTTKFNARPIFANITHEINKNLVDLWRSYLTMKGVS